MLPTPTDSLVEEFVLSAVEWLRLSVEAASAAIIAFGVVLAITLLLWKRQASAFNEVRLTLATYLALALEFQLAADILSTAVAPSWDKIGKLGAIAVIRTALNFFLMREIAMEKAATGKHPL